MPFRIGTCFVAIAFAWMLFPVAIAKSEPQPGPSANAENAEKKTNPDQADKPSEKIVYDEAVHGDLAADRADLRPNVRVTELGIHVVKGTGEDVKDDIDVLVFEVAAGTAFEFCLVADAAEFKKIHAVGADGQLKEIGFASTNLGFRAPRNLSLTGLPPGKYVVELMYGPNGASGPWVAKIGVREDDTPLASLCADLESPDSAHKMKHVDWPGAISIFHGHNWGTDEKYPVALKALGFGAAGCTEAQIEDCRRNGLRAFVFIWPHEAGVIPKQHRDDPTVLCYYLSDRIRPQQWGVWASHENTAYAAAPAHPAIFTMNADWGHLDQFCTIVRGRAMEYYHYHWDANRRPHMRYAHLEQLRQASTRHGDVPICRIVEVRPEDMRKTRQTIFTSLAYGVRGFRTGGRGIFHPEPDENGVPRPNAFGEELKRCNAAINAYSPVFKETRCVAVYHTAPLPAGCGEPPADAWVRIEGAETLVGVFEHKTEPHVRPDYLLVANRDAAAPRTARLTIASPGTTVQRMDTGTGQWVDVPARAADAAIEVSIELAEGGGELLKVQRRK